MTLGPGWIEVDLDAIAHNVEVVRKAIGSATPLCGVVKADAYGHGVDLVLPVLMNAGVTAIGVTSNEEASRARGLGFRGRIMRLRTALRDEIEDAVSAGVEEWAGGLAHAREIDAAARATGRRIPVHVSLNSTGLSRDGVELGGGRGRAELAGIGELAGLQPIGVCSHFPCEDEADVAAGAEVFRAQSAEAVGLLGGAPDLERHCATSYAALTVASSRFDLVRVGAALYGDTAAPVSGLRPALRLVSRIAAINTYPAGSTVGYDRTHRIADAARLAVVPLGYADGFHRVLGGRAHALVRGQRVPVVDRLAMNSLVLDVTAVPEARIADEVVLAGEQDGGAILARDLEEASGQIAADLYTAWGRLLPRRARAEREAT
ncbi:alanine racemase [Microbacterium sp. 13-71-7]|jgi:alanine racemase|uniref:alanine racemase n=1 Tax=Microbacterium sp. 13-71-7 TaxID=1970399 RepID=UPI000BDDEB5F|nr:alanine racemase [Microbacterium sp. 13-71-7]OZB85958.1 MAG: alanine racemase [Microbacterium sp. 13-71-7]